MVKLFCGSTKYDEDCIKYNSNLEIENSQCYLKVRLASCCGLYVYGEIGGCEAMDTPPHSPNT
jgi:hypothetical protein